jgi:hypothetical protein
VRRYLFVSFRKRTPNQLLDKDGHANYKERHHPCKLTEIQHDAAFHKFLPDFHCHGHEWTVLSGKLSKVSRFVRMLANGPAELRVEDKMDGEEPLWFTEI